MAFFAFKIGTANCVSYRYHPFCASLSPCVCRAGLYAADAPAPAAAAEADRRLACDAHRAGRDLCDRMGSQAACGREKLEYTMGGAENRRAALVNCTEFYPRRLQGKENSKRVCTVRHIPFLSAILWGHPRYNAGG